MVRDDRGQRAERVKVSKPSGGPTALIVDDDLGFVCWLSERFNEAGYRAIPAVSARQAGYIVHQLSLQITTIVVNPALRGVRGLIKILSHAGRLPVKIIAVCDPQVTSSILFRADAIVERPSSGEIASPHEWFRKLLMIL